MPLFCKQDSLLQNFLFNAGLPQLMSKSSLLTFEIPLLCLLHIFSPLLSLDGQAEARRGICDLRPCKETVADEEVKIAQVLSPALNQW